MSDIQRWKKWWWLTTTNHCNDIQQCKKWWWLTTTDHYHNVVIPQCLIDVTYYHIRGGWLTTTNHCNDIQQCKKWWWLTTTDHYHNVVIPQCLIDVTYYHIRGGWLTTTTRANNWQLTKNKFDFENLNLDDIMTVLGFKKRKRKETLAALWHIWSENNTCRRSLSQELVSQSRPQSVSSKNGVVLEV